MMKIPDFVQIKKSSIPNSGMGAFAKKDIKKGVILGEYIGKKMSCHDFDNKKSNTDYGFSVMDGHKVLFVLDAGNKKYSNWTRFINCPGSRDHENVKFYQYKKRIFIKTLRPILAGEEIMVWYGYEYGEKLLGYNIYE